MPGDAGGKVNIVGDESIGHCETEVHINAFVILNGC